MQLPKLGLGCAPLAHLYSHIPEQQALDLIHFTQANGAGFYDTAPLYGAGVSETRLGLALQGVPRDKFVLATKVGRLVQPDGSMEFDWSGDGVRRSLEESLRRLRLGHVEILHMHDPDHHIDQAINEAFPALAELRSQGVIRMIGCGVNTWELAQRLVRSCDLDCLLLAGRYTLLEQGSLTFMDECAAKGVKVLLGGVYNTGILATGAVAGAKYQYADAPRHILQQVRQMEALCAAHGISLRAAALHFPLAHPAVASLMVGAQSAGEYAQTLAAYHERVPPAFWQALRDAGLIDAAAPAPLN
jgi:D-threo-aldose 1-dehydrogenase